MNAAYGPGGGSLLVALTLSSGGCRPSSSSDSATSPPGMVSGPFRFRSCRLARTEYADLNSTIAANRSISQEPVSRSDCLALLAVPNDRVSFAWTRSERSRIAHNHAWRTPARMPGMVLNPALGASTTISGRASDHRPGRPWQCLYLSPDPQVHLWFRPTLVPDSLG